MNEGDSIKEGALPEVSDRTGWPWDRETSRDIYQAQTKWPKISIITPSYNQGAFIEETIRSVLLQNYPNLEFIVIDGGSTDETLDILKKYDQWITYWVSEKDEGQSHAINKGLKIATGELFNWINSDDFLAPNALYEIGKNFKKDSLAVCGYCNVFESTSLKTLYRYQISVHDTLEKTIVYCDMNQPATFLNLAKVRETGGINEKLHYAMDLDLWIKLLLRNGISGLVKVSGTIANFRVHAEAKGVSDRQSFKPDIYAVYVALAEKFIQDAAFVEHMKNLTQISSGKQDWEVTPQFSKQRFEHEMKSRFYDFLIYHYSLQQEYHICKSLFKEQYAMFGWRWTYGFAKEFVKYMLLPLGVFVSIKKMRKS